MSARSTIANLALLACVCIWGACSSSPGTPAGAAPAEPVTTHTVQIVEMTFRPEEIRVRKGDEIVFLNLDMVTHDVTEETSRAWHSPPIPAGESWTLKVQQSDRYFCSIHQVMKGRIVVE